MKRILVTGATGGLGRNAVDFLLERGVAIRATGRNMRIGALLRHQGAEFIAADLSTLGPHQARQLTADVDAVWHCAALSAPWGRRQAFIRCNVTATETLLEAAAAAGVPRFIHISTPAVYFDYTHHLNVAEDFRAIRYANDYAQTKAHAEIRVAEICAKCPATTAVILRPRAIFGPYDQVLMPRLAKVIEARAGRLPLPRSGNTLLDVTYAENVVHAMWLASVKPNLESCSVYNITNGEPTTIRNVLDALFVRELGQRLNIPRIPYPVMASAARLMEGVALLTRREPLLTAYSLGVLAYDMTLNINKAKRELGYQPVVGLQDGVARTARWLKTHGETARI